MDFPCVSDSYAPPARPAEPATAVERAHRRRYDAMVARLETLPPNTTEHSSLRTLAEITRPLDRPLARNERRVRLGSARRTLADRAIAYSHATGDEGPDASGVWLRDREPLIFDISGALVLGGQAVLVDDHLYASDFRWMPFGWRRRGFPAMGPDVVGFRGYDDKGQDCVVATPQDTHVLPTNRTYFLFNCYQARHNFGHMVHDTLSQIGAYRHVAALLGKAPTPIVLNEFAYPMQRFLFETMIRPLSECVKTRWRPMRVARCYTTDAMLAAACNEVSCAAFSDLRARLQHVAAEFGARVEDSPKKIYVSRADSDKVDERSFANADAVEAEILRAGYRPVVVGRLEPAEILGVFHGAQSVVGVHGAGMLNALFSQHDPSVTELWGYPSSWNSVAMVDWACRLEHRVVRCDAPETPGGRPIARIEEIRDAL